MPGSACLCLLPCACLSGRFYQLLCRGGCVVAALPCTWACIAALLSPRAFIAVCTLWLCGVWFPPFAFCFVSSLLAGGCCRFWGRGVWLTMGPQSWHPASSPFTVCFLPPEPACVGLDGTPQAPFASLAPHCARLASLCCCVACTRLSDFHLQCFHSVSW